jgi:hypothetical protein
MKRYVLAAVLFAVAPASGLFAQSSDMTAKIPFDFRLGDKLMPAGEYRVQQQSALLILKQQGSGHAAAAQLTTPSSRREASEKGALQFTRYGNQYFLSNVWTAGARDGRALRQSKIEKELARLANTVETAGIDLRSQ